MRLRVLAALAAAIAAGGAFVGAGRVLVAADPLPAAAADAIVVLAGSIPDRVLEAADLYHAGRAPRIVVTRERAPRGAMRLRGRGVRLPESDELTLIALRQLGVPLHAILVLRRRTYSTDSEAATIARWACAHRARSVIVVTSRYHSRRARLILRRAFGPGIALAVRPSPYDGFSARHWWQDRRDAKTVLSEYQKLAHFWLHERWRITPCGGLRRRAAGPA